MRTFESPSLFVTTETGSPGNALSVCSVPEDEVSAKTWLLAADSVSPMIERWLGPQPRTQLTVLDLPDPEDIPRNATLLVIPVRNAPPDRLSSVLSHSMTHAWMAPNPYWLNEGGRTFIEPVRIGRHPRVRHGVAGPTRADQAEHCARE